MNDNPEVSNTPLIAEAKESRGPSQQILAIKREIMTYAGSQAHFIDRFEQQEHLIIEQKQTIETLTNAIEGEPKTQTVYNSNRGTSRIVAYRDGGYKKELAGLQTELWVLKNRFEGLEKNFYKSQILLDEYRRTRPL